MKHASDFKHGRALKRPPGEAIPSASFNPVQEARKKTNAYWAKYRKRRYHSDPDFKKKENSRRVLQHRKHRKIPEVRRRYNEYMRIRNKAWTLNRRIRVGLAWVFGA